MTTIVQVLTDEEVADVEGLMRAFAIWRRQQRGTDTGPAQHDHDEQGVRDKFGEQFEDPETCASSRGRLLIAYEADQPAGCASLCDVGHGVCKVTRIFVAARFRGQRMGRALVERLLLEARAAGYSRMRLDTDLREVEAMRLCERTGFHLIGADQKSSDDMPSQHILFERDLSLAA